MDGRGEVMYCPMCPTWMGGGMLIATVIGVLLIVLLVMVIARMARH